MAKNENGFEPVKLTKDGANRTATTATIEANLRFNGWRSAPKAKTASAETPVPSAGNPKPAAPKN